MASTTGTITCHTDSVDYGGGRGAQYSNITLRWNLEGTTIRFNEEGYSTNSQNWWICNSNASDENQYRLELKVQFQPTGQGWQDMFTTSKIILGPCYNYDWTTGTNVKAILEELSARIPAINLPGSGNLRVLYYAAGTASTPAPSASYPYAFPNSVYSEASQVPIFIELDYRPGTIRNSSGTWVSHNRSGGTAHIRNGSWKEMKTSGGHSEKGNAPSIMDQNKTWLNQLKLGKE